MIKPNTENLNALVRGIGLNPYQLMLASNEMAFLFKYIEHLESKVDNGVLDDVSNCPKYGSANRVNVFCKDCGYDSLDE